MRNIYYNATTNDCNKVIVQSYYSIRSMIDYDLNITFVINIKILLIIAFKISLDYRKLLIDRFKETGTEIETKERMWVVQH